MRLKLSTALLSIISLTCFLFSCEDSTLNEIEPVPAGQVQIAEAPEEGSLPNGRLWTILPGLYGPNTVNSGQSYTYTVIMPTAHLDQYPGGVYHVYIQEKCTDTTGCTQEWSNVVSSDVSGNSVYINFPDEGNNKEWKVLYQYYKSGITGATKSYSKVIIAD